MEQNEQPVPLPEGAVNAAQQQKRVHAVQPPPVYVPDNLLMMSPPPPYYRAGMPQQYPYMYPAVQPQMLVPAVPRSRFKLPPRVRWSAKLAAVFALDGKASWR